MIHINSVPEGVHLNPYRKKPIIIYAAQVEENFEVESREGLVRGKPGDYLMKGVEGELYICAKEIFLKTYEPVSED